MRRLLAFLVVLAAAPSPGAAARFVTPDAPGDPLVVRELSGDDLELVRDAGSEALRVFVTSEDPVPSLLGSHEIRDGELRFTPRLPWTPGVEYRAILTVGGNSGEVRFLIPEHRLEPVASVLRVYPTAETVPANLLRFYVYFSEPMRGGDLYRNVRLVERGGTVVEQAFVETVPELWDPNRRRATLIVHPGRVKQGLEMRERAGPVFAAGETYRLVVEPEMRTARGLPLREGHAHRFTVGREDRSPPDPSAWVLYPPPADTRDPLRIELDEPLDHALLRRFVTVAADTGSVSGSVFVTDEACVFVPADPWAEGGYAVEIRPELEDLAGNRIDGPFDRPAGSARGESAPRRLPFRVHR